MKRFFLLISFLPLLLCCGGKEDIVELPPPVVQPGGNGGSGENGGENEDSGNGTHAWDANRGKIVTPSGTGWTTTAIRDGIVYYAFSGKDPVTNVRQEAFAIDLDLSKTQYEVKLTYTSPTVVTSDVHTKYNAIATMNAGYEAGSIYIRSDGKDKSSLPNTSIGSTGVPNWKSEAAFVADGKRSIELVTTGKLIRPYKSPDDIKSLISSQRNYCLKRTEPYIITSSPMLIDDYNPVGTTFINSTISNWSSLNSEEPQYHQRKRHPRTAVALTENNHFIMFVVDGRTNESLGMSAKELTEFLVQNFNPQYALNMDGGGSTTLCVEGQGDATTHVVNYPCDNSKHDHDGQRKRDTHFVIVEAK